MSKRTDRLELLSSLRTSINKVKQVHLEQADSLLSVVFSELGNKNVSLPRNPDLLIAKLNDGMDLAKDNTYTALRSEIDAITAMSAQQVMSKVPSLKDNDILQYLDYSTQLAIKYAEEKSPLDGLKLSERLWNMSDRQAVIDAVYRGIKEHWTSYELAEYLRNNIAENIPWKNLLRVAKTELTSAYSMGQVDTARTVVNDHPEFVAYAIIELSPYHPKRDICDVFVGEYELEKAPVTPFHGHCLCIFWTDIRFKKEPVPYTLTTVQENVTKYDQWIKDGIIYIPASMSKAFNIGVQTKPNSGMSTNVNTSVVRSVKNRKETSVIFPDNSGKDINLEANVTLKEAKYIKAKGIKLDSYSDSSNRNGYYTPINNTISIKRRKADEVSINRTLFHELGHAIDYTKNKGEGLLEFNRLSSSAEFKDLLNNTGVINGFIAKSWYQNILFRYTDINGNKVSFSPTITQVKELLDTKRPIIVKTVDTKVSKGYQFIMDRSYLKYFEEYTKSNKELFAEMYAQFRLDPEGLAKDYPNIFKYVANIFNTL